MVIGKQHKFVFIMVPKTASQSMRFWLIDNYGGDMPRGQSHERNIPQRCKDWFTFCCVRNPYDRAISLWFSAVYEEPKDAYGFRRGCGSSELTPFLRWLAQSPGSTRRHVLAQPQHIFLRPVATDLVLRYENLQTEINQLPFHDASSAPLPSRNVRKTRRPPWESYYDPERTELVQAWAKEDFTNYGYPLEITQ
jgi:hypothetical protein